MPIQQITERKTAPVIGKIRLGIKKEGQNSQYPSNTDYFVLHDAPQVIEHYGSEPKELDIVFPSDDLESVMPTWLKWYGTGTKGKDGKTLGGNLKCMGNGPNAAGEAGEAKYFVNKDQKTGAVPMRPCLGEKCPDWLNAKGERQCKPAMQLYVMLPKVSPFGVFRIDTTSWTSVKSFHDQIEWIRQLNGGRIALIPFKLVKEQREVKYRDKNGLEQKKPQWIMVLKPNENKEQIEGMRQNLELLGRAALSWKPTQELLEGPMEDNYATVDVEAADIQAKTAQNVQTAEQLAADPEVVAAFDRLGKAYNKDLSLKDRIIKIRQKEREPNVKAAVLTAVEHAISELEKKKKGAAVPAPEAPPVAAVVVHPDSQGLI